MSTREEWKREQDEKELEEFKTFMSELGGLVFDVVGAIRKGSKSQTAELFEKAANLLWKWAK